MSTGRTVAKGCLPVAKPLNSFWSLNKDDLSNHRSTDSFPGHSDVVIIGAGYSGVSMAYHLLKQAGEKPLSITILEARDVCSGATGRNGGHLRPDYYGVIPTYIDRAGRDAAEEVARFEIAHLPGLKKVIEEERIDCDLTLTRSLDVWCDEESAKQAKSVYDRLVAEGFEYMKDVIFYTGKDVEGICGVKGAVACASYPAGTLWPYKLIMHLTRSILKTGKVNLQTWTPATAVENVANGAITIRTPRGNLRTSKVIHASNAYVASTLPEYRKSIVPCKNLCCRITVPEPDLAPSIYNSYTIRKKDGAMSYLIPRRDGSIIVGGASSVSRDFLDQWYDNVDDGSLIDAAKDYYRDFMQQTFRGWQDTAASVDMIWTGIIGYSYDTRPHIGPVPERSGQFILAGFNGHGMPVIWLAAKELARIVLDDIPFEKTAIPRLFKTTQSRIDRARFGKECDGDILGVEKVSRTKL